MMVPNQRCKFMSSAEEMNLQLNRVSFEHTDSEIRNKKWRLLLVYTWMLYLLTYSAE
jgi:hypothetical protein